MENKDKQPLNHEEIVEFVENTRAGRFSGTDISFRELLQCTISREDVILLENNNIQDVGTILYGIH